MGSETVESLHRISAYIAKPALDIKGPYSKYSLDFAPQGWLRDLFIMVVYHCLNMSTCLVWVPLQVQLLTLLNISVKTLLS